MIINKYQGKTEEEAKLKAREELGDAAVIMNVKEVRPKGLFGVFKSSTYEVTAAIEDDVLTTHKKPMSTPEGGTNSRFDMVVDEELPLAPGLEEDSLRDAFAAVNEVIEQKTKEQENAKKQQVLHAPNPGKSSEQAASKQKEATYSKPKEATYSKPQATRPPKQQSFAPLETTAPKLHLYGEDETAAIPSSNYNDDKNLTSQKSLEEQLSARNRKPMLTSSNQDSIDSEKHKFVKMLYNVLLENEVQEKYINQVLDDMDRILATSHSLDNLLSSVYQKMVLKLGTPNTITIGVKRPKVVFFIGPTGVGKTTTIAKIASKFKVEDGKSVGLITADTYRMAAADQLKDYANILSVPMSIVYEPSELNDAIRLQLRDNPDTDVILVDTLGFSHKNEAQKDMMKELIYSLDEAYDKDVYLVLSATTKYKDLVDIADTYKAFIDYNLIFTKLDETSSLGNIYNIKQRSGAALSYFTLGQNVPDDIEIVNTQKLVKQLLGGN